MSFDRSTQTWHFNLNNPVSIYDTKFVPTITADACDGDRSLRDRIYKNKENEEVLDEICRTELGDDNATANKTHDCGPLQHHKLECNVTKFGPNGLPL